MEAWTPQKMLHWAMKILAQIQRDKIQFYKIEFIPTE